MKLLTIFKKIISPVTPKKLQELIFHSPEKTPQHIAIIPDGNRRWAKHLGKLPLFGHEKGVDTFFDTITRARQRNVKVITFYTFSTENWQRPKLEVRGLMRLLKDKITEKVPEMLRLGIRLRTIGDLSQIPEQVQEAIIFAKEQTSICRDIDLVLAINYGGRKEILRACQKAVADIAKGKLLPEELSEERFSTYLDTNGLPDPDLVIRTSGEQRISNFLIWQSSYAEFYSLNKKWPEFTPDDLDVAIEHFKNRKRRLGK